MYMYITYKCMNLGRVSVIHIVILFLYVAYLSLLGRVVRRRLKTPLKMTLFGLKVGF